MIRLFLSGDVMTGRGIGQVMAHPGDPVLYESSTRSALDYVRLAERRNGAIPHPVEPDYVWGDALEELDDADVAVRVVNLETTVTDHDEPWPGKGVHYRMHPGNVDVLTAAKIDCCMLANNHILDWSYSGLDQTLSTLHEAGLATVGAGLDADSASQPTILETPSSGRVVLVAIGLASSGIPGSWSADEDRPGVAYAEELSDGVVEAIADRVGAVVESGDLVVASIHWGSNWGYDIPRSHRGFAHALIDDAGVDIIHGHSSHHPLGIEVYRSRLILYGCGDLINDYEGIRGYESFRHDLGLLYLVTVDSESGKLDSLDLIPVRMRRFRLERAPTTEVVWLADTLTRVGRPLGTRIDDAGEGRLVVSW